MSNWFYLIGSICFLIGTLINMAHADSYTVCQPGTAPYVCYDDFPLAFHCKGQEKYRCSEKKEPPPNK